MRADELTTELRVVSERVQNTVVEVKELSPRVQELQREVAVLRQRLEDHIKRADSWEARRWTVVMFLAGGMLSIVTGLIVGYYRK